MVDNPRFVGEMIRGRMLDYVTLGGARPSRFDGICGYASTSAVADGFVSSNLIEKVTYDNRPARANQVASCGDVILARMQSTSKVLEIDEENSGLIYSTGFAVLTPDSSMISQRCLFHLLLSAPFRRRKDQLCTGATQKAITNAGLKKLQVAFPAHKYQEQVVKELDNVLQQIEASRQRLNMLDSLAKSRFVEMFDASRFERCVMGDLVANIISGTNVSGQQRPLEDGEYGVLRISAVTRGVFNPNEYKAVANTANINMVHPHRGDLLFSRANTSEMVGATAIVDADYDRLFLPDKLWRLDPVDGVESVFLKALLSSPAVRSEMSKVSTGSSGSMQNISMAKFRKLSAFLPPLSLQRQFADFVAQVDKSRFVVLNEKISRIQLISRRIAHRFSR